ncbi:MAG: TonB-dependent receptor plug domain-containing protein [Hyphomonadaceae bacterium]
MFAAAFAMAGAAQAQETTPPAPGAGNGAAGETTAANGQVSFAPDYFARFSPQNALDMVRRVPGFVLDEGDTERRGFSGAVGNVLIDGRRPSTKSQDLESVLSRIPAAQVERIELIRDTGSTADAAGQSQLINIVRTPSAGSGVWEGTLEQNTNGRVSPRGSATWTGRTGQIDYSIGASRYLEYRPLDGERFFADGAGALTASAVDISPRTYREADINAELTAPVLGGSLRVNGQVDRWNFRAILDTFAVDPLGDPIGDNFLNINERQQSEELGMNFERDIGPASLTLVGLATRRHYSNDESTQTFDGLGAFEEAVAQSRRNDIAETIGRATLSFPLAPGHRFDVGGEIAFNSLDANLSLTVDEGLGPMPIALPSANVLVEEQRAEAFATLASRLPGRWALEATLAGETSTLTQTGDTDLETELAYIKPSIQFTRQFGERNQMRFRFYRDVDQLDFGDFVSAATLADDIVAAGNPNLRPETSWRAEAAFDFRFGTDGALGVRFFNHWLSDASDVVPVGVFPDIFAAPGNIGDGWVHGVQVTATVPLGFILPGARLTADIEVQDSQVTDPVTGDERVISGFVETDVELEFRQDFTAQRFAWGINYYKDAQNITFRINETDTYEEGPFVDLWVETTAIPGVRVRAFVNNVLDSDFTRRREFYDVDRNGPLIGSEYRERNFGPFWGITISGTL